MTAPDVFSQDPDGGLLLPLHAAPPTAHMAASLCPARAITLHEPEPGDS
ncbi:ferredoxin [Streptomyces sp. NPDC014870]